MANFLNMVKKHRTHITAICITALLCLACFFITRALLTNNHVREWSVTFADNLQALYEISDKDTFFDEILPEYLDNIYFKDEKIDTVVFYRIRNEHERGTVLFSNISVCPVDSTIQEFLRSVDAYVCFNDMISNESGYYGPVSIDGVKYHLIYYSPDVWDVAAVEIIPDKVFSGILITYNTGYILLALILVIFAIFCIRVSHKKEKILSDELANVIRTMKDKDARMDLLSYLMNEFTFEYDVANDTLTMSEKYQRIFQRGRNFLRFKETIKSHYTIYHLDVDNLLAAYDKITSGIDEGSILFRLQMTGGNYEWFNALYKVMYNDDHKPSYVVGKMVNVHQSQTEKEMLLTKSTRDPLTNLLNRSEIEKRTTSYIGEMDSEDLAALLIMDLDHFKQVNDTFGHSKGDDLLRDVAVIIRDSFRTNDIVGRLGGDEFYVFMKDIANESDAVSKCEKLRISLEKDVTYGEKSVSISSSMGIVFVREGMQFLDIYMKADSALYRAKETGRNRICVYSDSDNQEKK